MVLDEYYLSILRNYNMSLDYILKQTFQSSIWNGFEYRMNINELLVIYLKYIILYMFTFL